MATPIDDNAADGQLGKSRWQLLSIRYTLLEKLRKYSALFAIGILRLHLKGI